MQDAEAFNPNLSLLQNALMLWLWAKQTEPNPEELAFNSFVDYRRLREGSIARIRALIADHQERLDGEMQLGGPGIDVEMDEVSPRAKAVKVDDITKINWYRWFAAAERGRRPLVLWSLPVASVKGAGQGGGKLSDKELHDAISGWRYRSQWCTPIRQEPMSTWAGRHQPMICPATRTTRPQRPGCPTSWARCRARGGSRAPTRQPFAPRRS